MTNLCFCRWPVFRRIPTCYAINAYRASTCGACAAICHAPHHHEAYHAAYVSYQDAVCGARWGLEYLELPGDIWASELTSQIHFTKGKTLRPALAEKSKITEIYVRLLGGVAPSVCLPLLFREYRAAMGAAAGPSGAIELVAPGAGG